MNKFEDHWRKKMDDPEGCKDLLKEKGRAAMWEKIQASKNGFEQDWQKKVDNPEGWEGTLEEATKKELWDNAQIPLAQFELQWREKIEEINQVNGVFLDDAAKERIAAIVFAGKETFEIDWQDKMDDPVFEEQAILNDAAKDRIWHSIQSGNHTIAPVPEEKRKPGPALRWSHAAALLIGACTTWLIWDQSSVPLQNTLVATPPEKVIIPAVTQKEKAAEQQETVNAEQDVLSKSANRTIAKARATAPVKESRERIERVSGNIRPVKAIQAAVVLAGVKPVMNTKESTVSEAKANTVPDNPGIEVAINKTAPAKKVVHISDIRPAGVSAKGATIYGRAFGEGKEKRNEKSTMTFNSVLKNYK